MSDLFERPGAHLEGLNSAQREAVVHEDGPLIVLAGPGTGKTRVITRRIVHMIADRGADPGSILALTFTNKAAGEMRERLGDLLDPVTAERVHAHTFNGFGASLLRRFSDLAGLPGEPELIDSAQRIRIMRTIVRDRGLFRDAVASGLDSAIGNAQKLIAAMTAAALTPAAAHERLRAHQESLGGLGGEALDAAVAELSRLREAVELWDAFDSACLDRGLISFDHQVAWSNRVLREKPIAGTFVRQDYRHVVVDEFQDVNDAQIELLRLIAPPESVPDLCVVGDDDQAIYGFRGADDRAFQKFEAAWPSARTVMLEENYRSASPVLAVASSIIGRAHERFRPDKVVRRADGLGEDPAGAVVEGVRLESYKQAGEAIASMIRADLESRPDATPGDHAVIARGWTEIDRIRATLEVEGLPCRVSRGRAPADDPGVLDVMAWIDLLLHPVNTWAARRLLLRPPFSTSVEWVNTAENAYRAMVSRLPRRGPGVEPDGGTDPQPGYMAWLSESIASGVLGCDPRVRGSVDRLVGVWDGLRSLAVTAPAHEVIGQIVRRADVVHAELLDGRGRAARVSAVVGLLRFAAERSRRLEEPGDLRAFMSYYEDLDSSDRTFRTARLTHEDDETGDGADKGAAAVQLLTGHGAKGLEFDTVYLPRVETKNGFPTVREPVAGTTLPGWLSGDHDAGPAALQDEERRLFYVACTRAQRRLVALAAVPKKRPNKTNYFFELLDEPGLIVEREVGEVLGPYARDGVDHETPRPAWNESEKRRDRIRIARRNARLDAAVALEEAATPGLDGAGFDEAGDRLRDAAARLGVVASAQRGERPPAWAVGDELLALHAALSDIGVEPPVISAADVLRPMRAPLDLSYTMLSEWETCPRCFAVRFALGLPEPETAKTVVGKAVHEALQAFYSRIKRAGEEGSGREPTLTDLLDLGRDRFDAQWSASDVIDASQRETVLALLRQGYESLHRPGLNPVDTERKIVFPYHHAGRHRFTAKIDRIDESPEGFRVVDYKTGKAAKRLTQPKKSDRQFGIYALAMRAYIAGGGAGTAAEEDAVVGEIDAAGPPAGGAEYWVLATGERGRVTFDELAEHEPKLRESIDSAIDGMLSGTYPRGKNCRGACVFLDPSEFAEDAGPKKGPP